MLICLTLFICFKYLVDCYRKQFETDGHFLCGVSLACLALACLYSCFGPVVMQHYTGYLKACSLFFFTIPFLMSSVQIGKIKKYFISSLLIFILLITSFHNLMGKVLRYNGDFDVEQVTHYLSTPKIPIGSCFSPFSPHVVIKKSTLIKKGILFGKGSLLIFDVELMNNSHHVLTSIRNKGGVFMSYQWLDQAGNVVINGFKTALPEMQPGDLVHTKIVSYIPITPHGRKLFLKVGLLQEGCGWFYPKDTLLKAQNFFIVE